MSGLTRFKATESGGSRHQLLLGHGECQIVVGHLDLVLGIQVGHALRAHAVDGHNDVSLNQVGLRRLAARRDLDKNQHGQTELGQYREKVRLRERVQV